MSKKKEKINKKIITIWLIITSIIILLSILFYKIDLFESPEEKLEKEMLWEEAYKQYKQEQKWENTFSNLRTKYENKWLLLSADKHLANDEYILALKNYTKAYNNNKNDPEIIEKIANTYFKMKNWKSAYKYYYKIKDEEKLDKNKIFLSLLYATNIKDEEKNFQMKEIIETIFKDKEDIFYYENSLLCTKDFSLCKKNFKDEIDKLNKDKIPLSINLQNINEALQNYENFKVDELYFKDALVIWWLFKSKLYPITAILWENLTKDRPDYKPALKIIIQSYFELGDYKTTKTLLSNYYNIDGNDPSISYMLAIVYQKLNKYLLSNVHFDKALKLNYMQDEIYRLEIYNSFMLQDGKKIIALFDSLIKIQEKPKLKDLIIATYYNLANGKIERWEEIADLWIKHYPTEADFHGFKWWIAIEKNDLVNARIELEKWFKLNPENALVNLNLWRLEKASWNEEKSIIYFTRSKNLDNSWDISKEATKHINEIKNWTWTNNTAK